MAQNDSSAWLVVLVAGIAVVGLVLSASTFYTHNTFGGMMGGVGGGMMNGGTPTAESTGPGSFEWAILLVSAALFGATLLLWFRSRSAGTRSPEVNPGPPSGMTSVSAAPTPSSPSAGLRPDEAVGELTLVKLLDGDEKRMYLELREHGGTMLQRDIVDLGIFSKAKVTRVLDKLEAKGLAVREAHGMTNLVRLVNHTAK